jgi:hypothetical protein
MTDNYHDRPEVSATDLRRAAERGGWYAIWCRHNPRKSPAMDVGTRIHAAMLEADTIDPSRYVQRPDGMSFATKEGKAWKAEQEAAGLTVVEANEFAFYRDAAGVLADWHALLRTVPGVWTFEEPITWTDPDTATECRCKPDAVCFDGTTVSLWSVKTTAKPVTPASWRAQVESRFVREADGSTTIFPGYDLGERHYAEGLAAHLLGDASRWREVRVCHVIVPTEGPLALYIAPVPAGLLERIGEARSELLHEVNAALHTYPDCVPSGIMSLTYEPSIWAQRGGEA